MLVGFTSVQVLLHPWLPVQLQALPEQQPQERLHPSQPEPV